MKMEDYSKASPLPMEAGSMRRKELSKSSLSSLGNGTSPQVNREEAQNPRRRGRPPKNIQKPDVVVGKGLLITSRGKHVNPGLAIHARNTFTNKFPENSFPGVLSNHDENPASNSKRQACPPAKKQKHNMVEMLGKNNLSKDPESKYQERTSATAVEDTCVRLLENQEEVNGELWIPKGKARPPKKKQKQELLEVTGSKDFPKYTGRFGLTCYEKETLQARETAHNVAVNSRSLLQDAVDSTSESEDFSNSYSSEVEKNKEPRKFVPRSNEIFENGSKAYDDRSLGLVREQHFELEKEKESPHYLASKRTEGLSDTSEKTHNRGRKKVATTDLPPDELRCIRSDGRSWRCTAYAIPGGRRCQKHLLQLVAAQKKQQMNKGSAFVRVTSGKAKFQPSDFGIVTEELKRREPASDNLHEKASGRILPSSTSPLVQRSLYVNIPSSKNDILSEHPKNLNKELLLSSNCLSPSHTGKGQTECSPDDGVSKLEQGKSCHQCERNDKGAIILCLKCNQRRYCLCCITRWYSDLSESEVQRACPFCRGRCVCKSCLRLKQNVKEEVHMNMIERLKCLQYMLAFILPFLKGLNEVQGLELELESTLRGSPVTKLIRAPIGKDDCVLCDNCGTSIVDFHRSCPDCDYDLCLTCCQELRQGGAENLVSCPDSPGQLRKNEELDQVCDPLSGNPISEAISASVFNGKAEVDISQVASKSTVWRANEDGSIPCAPPERGCGSPFLILKTLHRVNFLENLAKEVEASIDSYVLPVESECQACALCDVGQLDSTKDTSSSPSRLAAQRSTANDNFIYSPHNHDTRDKDMQHFQRHWNRGEPVIVKDVLRSISDACWEPMAMWRATQQFTRHYMHDELKFVTAIDCFNWQEVDVSIHDFLRGYEVGYMDQNGWPKMMKLDWPPSSIFEERLSRHCAEFISCIPFAEYTHPKKGILNLAAKFPEGEAKPDLGPKSDIAYGVADELGVGDSVTKLQCGASDMVCVLVHTSEVKLTAWQWKKAHQSRERLEAGREAIQAIAEPVKACNHQGLTKCTKGSETTVYVDSIAHGHENPENVELHVALELSDEEQLCSRKGTSLFESDCRTGGRQVTETAPESICYPSNMEEEYTSDKERHENESAYASESDDSSGAVSEGTKVAARGGAVWDVFRRQDIPKLQAYLEKFSKDLKHQATCEIVHPIHDQLIFLNEEHKKRLKEEFQIEAWTFEQNIGEAVYIPAGCPFQVRNLKSCTKVALDFVSPENLKESLRVTEEYRLLPRNHHANEDKLQVKNMIVYAASQAVAEIRRLKADKR